MSKNKIKKEILDAFPPEEREKISRLWELADSTSNENREGGLLTKDHRDRMNGVDENSNAGNPPDNISLKPDELHSEWQRLQQRIHQKERSTKSSEPISGKSKTKKGRVRNLYAWTAAVAAAILIGGFFGWYLFVPATIEAPYGTFVTHEWSDGVQVELNSGSKITWNRRFGSGHRNLSLHGEAYFEVPTSDKPFVVETHNARVSVFGTRFNVRSWMNDPDQSTVLTLVDGEVALSSFRQPNEPVILQPGHWSRINRHIETPGEPEPVDTNRALAWRNQGFYFASITLEQVSAELERRFNTPIQIEDETLADRTLTLYIPSPDDLESIIETISNITSSRYRWSEERLVLY